MFVERKSHCAQFVCAPLLLLALALGAAAQTARADGPIPLFPATGGNGAYAARIWTLKPGDEVRFSDGKVFKLGERLGYGRTTMVFALADFPDRTLRIPYGLGPAPRELREKNFMTYEDFITGYVTLHSALVDRRVSVVAIHASRPGEYVVTDRIPEVKGRVLTLDRFFTEGGSSPEEERELTGALLQFVRSLSAFDVIGDFKANQVAYDPNQKRWVLFDWAYPHVLRGQEEKGALRAVEADLEFALDFAGMLNPARKPFQERLRERVREASQPGCPESLGRL